MQVPCFSLAAILIVATAAPGAPLPNRLVAEDSTYLRALSTSPVDWYPWGPEAFAEAERSGRPVFVSIGYASCLWSARMDREVFADPAVAALLNDASVNIKIDRFERPDLDRLCQRFVEAAGQRAGWPLNLWMTADRRPLRAADALTLADEGQGSFRLELDRMRRLWAAEGDALRERARRELTAFADRIGPALAGPLELDDTLTARTEARLLAEFDPVHGGFGRVPKFPSPARLTFLAVRAARPSPSSAAAIDRLAAVQTTLDRLSRSALHDPLGGGFFRYALDDGWRRPYFEKLALDQACHAEVFLLGHRLTGDPRLAATALRTLEYAVRDLGHPEGGFYTGEHAESRSTDGEPAEGAWYLWPAHEFREAAGPAAGMLTDIFDIRDRGNLPPGADSAGPLATLNTLAEIRPPAESAARLGRTLPEIEAATSNGLAALRAARDRRPRPALDRLIVTQMNAALVSALARAGTQLEAPELLARARQAADFILSTLWDAPNATLYRCRLDRAPRHHAAAEDYAFLVRALLDLHETTGEIRWLRHAFEVQSAFDRHHADPAGGYFDARSDLPDVPASHKSIDDAASFSPNAVAGQNLVRWGVLLGQTARTTEARRLLAAFAAPLRAGAGSVAGLSLVTDSLLHPPRRVILFGTADTPAARAARHRLAVAPPGRWVVLSVENEDARRWLSTVGALPAAAATRPLNPPGIFTDGAPMDEKESTWLQELHKFHNSPR